MLSLLVVAAAGMTPGKRWVGLPVAAVSLVFFALCETFRFIGSSPHVIFWFSSWCDVVGVWVLYFAAAAALLERSGRVRLPLILLMLLCCQMAAWALQEGFGLSRWAFSDGRGAGLFSCEKEWAAYCAIALPLLWRWSRWAAIPAALGLLISPSASAYAALAAGLLLALPKRWGLPAAGLLAAGVLAQEHALMLAISMRLESWQAALRTIAETPMGIGWGMNSYFAVVENASGPILPYCPSDLLNLPLRYGWWVLLPMAFSMRSVARMAMPERSSLVIATCLGAWQAVLQYPSIGALIFVIWAVNTLEETHGKEEIVRRAQG